MFRKHKVVWVSVAIVAVILGSMAGSYATAKASLNPIDGNSVISAAYQKVNGMLRLVNGEEDVNPSEVFIQWNQLGPQGPQGPTGPQGSPGGIDEASEQEIKDGICAICESLEMVEEAPGFCFAIKQRQTIELMMTIATANTIYRETAGELEYAPSLEALVEWWEERFHIRIHDGWGNMFVYYRDPEHPSFLYTLTSLGYDGIEGPAPPEPWFFGESGESDIICGESGWLQRPE